MSKYVSLASLLRRVKRFSRLATAPLIFTTVEQGSDRFAPEALLPRQRGAPQVVSLSFARPHGFKDLNAKAFAERVRERVQVGEETAAAERRRTGARGLGRRAVLDQKWSERPGSRESRRQLPNFAFPSSPPCKKGPSLACERALVRTGYGEALRRFDRAALSQVQWSLNRGSALRFQTASDLAEEIWDTLALGLPIDAVTADVAALSQVGLDDLRRAFEPCGWSATATPSARRCSAGVAVSCSGHRREFG